MLLDLSHAKVEAREELTMLITKFMTAMRIDPLRVDRFLVEDETHRALIKGRMGFPEEPEIRAGGAAAFQEYLFQETACTMPA